MLEDCDPGRLHLWQRQFIIRPDRVSLNAFDVAGDLQVDSIRL